MDLEGDSIRKQHEEIADQRETRNIADFESSMEWNCSAESSAE